MRAEVLSCQTLVVSPGPGVGVLGSSYYTEREGGRLARIHSYTSRSDTVDAAFVCFSDDNGRSWGEEVLWEMKFEHPEGTGRRHPRGGYVDSATGRYVTVWTEGVLPNDDPLEGMWRWTMFYSVSDDGGRTQKVHEQIVHDGETYDAIHHLPGVTVGKNCVMIGDLGQRPMTRSDGVILIPVQTTPTGPDGHYFNPGAGYTYTDCMMLMGRWADGGRLSWTCSERIVGDPQRTTRGLVEPTIAELSNGSILMVMRGSNDAKPELPGHKWMALSHDGGQTWSEPTPWTFDDGVPFFSPSATSQLIPYSDGRLLWMGNVCGENPRGNRPRYPIVLGQVDLDNGLLLRNTVTVIEDRQEGESERLTLSNFYAREDRETGDLLLQLPRFFASGDDGENRFTADLMMFRIAVN